MPAPVPSPPPGQVRQAAPDGGCDGVEAAGLLGWDPAGLSAKAERAYFERVRGKPDPRAVQKDVHLLLKYLTMGMIEMTIHSDDHKAYPRAMRIQAPS